MAGISSVLFLCLLAACSALPTGEDPVIRKLDPGERYQYMSDDDGELHLVDLWLKASDLEEAARYSPNTDNHYHLFTRQNPTVSQPIVMGNEGLLSSTNFNPARRVIVIVHGWLGHATVDTNTILVPAFLAAEDVNVIVVDWSAGASSLVYAVASTNTVTSGRSVATFINWLNRVSRITPNQYHLVGFSLGAHQVGIVGRNLDGTAAYITGLDPALPGWIINRDTFKADDGDYTEVIHTNAGGLGYLLPLGQVDFYPNGGLNMPGCLSPNCDHSRSYHYMAETLSGGFTARQCYSYIYAMSGLCYRPRTLNMGGLVPKRGETGIYYLTTNRRSPFSTG